MLSCVDTYMEGRWEQKGIYVFYLQLLTDLLHLFVYLVFFTITFANYGLPLHLVSSCATSAQAGKLSQGALYWEPPCCSHVDVMNRVPGVPWQLQQCLPALACLCSSALGYYPAMCWTAMEGVI